MISGYLTYRCPHCGSDRCGNDANAGWDVVSQQSVLLGEFDNQWCNDCGDVTLEEYTITDQSEIDRIEAARVLLHAEKAGPQLLDAARSAVHLLDNRTGVIDPAHLDAARAKLADAIAMAKGGQTP
jgi:hypothetical protein